MGTEVTFIRPDGKEARGYLAKPGRAGAPGIVVLQEWWGLQDQIRGMADRLALAGFEALAPDLYAGKVVPYHDPEAAGHSLDALDFIDATDQTIRGAVQYLKRSAPKAGVTGFCMGGALTVLSATRIPELDAGVAFYGIPPASAAPAEKLRVPLQGHFSLTDDYFKPEAVDAFEKAAKAAKKTVEFHRYEADHAFMNEQRPVHDRAAADLAWGRMLAFWQKTLG